MKKRIVIVGIGILFVFTGFLWAKDEEPSIYPTAIFPFAEHGVSVKEYGRKASDILFAKMAERPEVILVERTEIDKILQEIELGLSGVMTPEQASKVGKITGAKILITGSVFEVEKKLYVVAKIIGTETSRVLGKSVAGSAEEFANLVETLSTDVGDAIAKEGKDLVAQEEGLEDRIAKLKKQLGKAKRPVVLIKINERHIGQPTIDPSAQTELVFFCKETGFVVIDPEKGNARDADIIMEGEGFSEFAMRKGNLVSVKARLEVKATERNTGKIIVADRQTEVSVDLTEQIAGKKALEQAAAAIAERILPKLVGK